MKRNLTLNQFYNLLIAIGFQQDSTYPDYLYEKEIEIIYTFDLISFLYEMNFLSEEDKDSIEKDIQLEIGYNSSLKEIKEMKMGIDDIFSGFYYSDAHEISGCLKWNALMSFYYYNNDELYEKIMNDEDVIDYIKEHKIEELFNIKYQVPSKLIPEIKELEKKQLNKNENKENILELIELIQDTSEDSIIIETAKKIKTMI